MALTRKSGSPPIPTWDGRAFRILALDPGGTTGWALAQSTPHGSIDYAHGHIGPHEHHSELFDFVTGLIRRNTPETPELIVVCESFEFRQHINKAHEKTKVELVSKEYIGILKLICEQLEVKLVFQTASEAKQLIPDKGPQAHEKLKALGLYQPAMKHANDAYRHLIRYMVLRMKVRSILEKWL